MATLLKVILITFIFLDCKKAPDINSQYSIFELTQYDSVKVYLLENLSDTLDEVFFKNYSSFLEDKYLDFKIDYSKGWSCLYIDSLRNLENQRRHFMPFVEIEERFLNKIIYKNKLKAGDESEIIKYWKQLQNTQSVSSKDDRWKINLDSFKTYVVNNTQPRIFNQYILDSCEVLMYKTIFNEMDVSKNDEVWISIDWVLSRKMPYNSNIYFNRIYKRCTFKYNTVNFIEVEIEDMNSIKFR